jgi:hypothetical protein
MLPPLIRLEIGCQTRVTERQPVTTITINLMKGIIPCQCGASVTSHRCQGNLSRCLPFGNVPDGRRNVPTIKRHPLVKHPTGVKATYQGVYRCNNVPDGRCNVPTIKRKPFDKWMLENIIGFLERSDGNNTDERKAELKSR